MIQRQKGAPSSLEKTPLVGGISVLLPWILTGSNAILVELLSLAENVSRRNGWLAILILTITLVGALDDRLNLTARLRLAVIAPQLIFFFFATRRSVFCISHHLPSAFLSPWGFLPAHSLIRAFLHLPIP